MATPKEPSAEKRFTAGGLLVGYPGDSGPQPLADLDQRFRLFVERVEDYAIFMLDTAGRVATWNEGAERIMRYSAREIIGQPMSRFYTAEDVAGDLPAQLLETAEAAGRVEAEGWRLRKDGSRFWASVSITAIRDERERLQGFGKVTRDLTERRRAEDFLRQLSARLLEAQDRERKRISASLNDSTSPNFVALLSKLYQAKKRTDGTASQLIDDGIALAEFLYREIRTVSYLLHPPSLESDGLLATLQAHLEGLARHKGIAVGLDFPANLERLPEAAEVALYRVVQECLSSVIRLSGNSRAKARLSVEDGRLTLAVGDEGQGLPAEALQDARRGVGELGVAIAGMRERMVRLGGTLEITATHSSTWVTATLPVRQLQSP